MDERNKQLAALIENDGEVGALVRELLARSACAGYLCRRDEDDDAEIGRLVREFMSTTTNQVTLSVWNGPVKARRTSRISRNMQQLLAALRAAKEGE